MNSLLIEASAGSGKTFQLSNRFLALLVLDQSPADLIALTFTRKAAGEFSRRILNRLAAGAADEEGAKALTRALTPTLLGDPDTGQPALASAEALQGLGLARYRELLKLTVQELDRLKLGTLDAFFAQLIRCFGPELGVPQFQMLDESSQPLEQQAVLEDVLKGDQLNERQRQAFLTAFELASFGKEEVRITDSVLEFVESYHEKFLQDPRPEAWGDAATIWPGRDWLPEFSPELAARLAEELRDCPEEDCTDKRQPAWFAQVADELEAYHPGSSLSSQKRLSSLFDKCLPALEDLRRGSGSFKHYKLIEPSPQRARCLASIIDHIIEWNLQLLSKRTAGVWQVIQAFEVCYHERSRSRGRLGFSDIALLLQQNSLLAEAQGFNTLAYRLDSKFRHWMLDEFQDTSRQQFDVIEPAISEAVNDPDGERSLFVVGDTKQAIYGWRNGEPRLFGEMRERPDWPGLEAWTMSRSYRSSQAVLDFVNLVCDPAGPAMQGLFPEAALERWHFQAHERAPVLPPLSGCASVYEVLETKDEEEQRSSYRACLALLEEQQPIERGLSCAILVGSNAQVGELAAYLRQHSSWPIETESAVPICQDNPLGLALRDYFRFLVYPGDRFAREHIHRSPLWRALRDSETSEDRPDLAWIRGRRETADLGISPHLDRVAKKLRKEVDLGSFQEMRLRQIQDAARAFDEGGGSLEEWLKRLESLCRSEASQSGAIQIMTVHKSKGLEFDLVILPELKGRSFDDDSRQNLLVHENQSHLPDAFLISPNKAFSSADPILSQWRDQWITNNCFERFCNLYVAITRAARACILILPPPPKKGEDRLNPVDWVRRAVGDVDEVELSIGREHPLDCRRLYQAGDPDWFESAPIQPAGGPAEAVDTIHLAPPFARAGRRTASGEKAEKFQPHRRGGQGDFLQKQGAMHYGNQVHQLFEGIDRYCGEALPDTAAGRAVKACLDLPESEAWFNPAPETRILRETAIEAIDEDGAWFSGVIDRALVHHNEAGEVARVEILDFKTDKVDAADLLRKRYAGQMSAYIRYMRELYSLPEEAVSGHFLSTHLLTYV